MHYPIINTSQVFRREVADFDFPSTLVPYDFHPRPQCALQLDHGRPSVGINLLGWFCLLFFRGRRTGSHQLFQVPDRKAFLNDKLDLAQAEAVADLVASGSREAARAALRSLEGALSRRVADLADALTELRAFIEAAMDFPDEELDLLDGGRIRARIEELLGHAGELRDQARQGRLRGRVVVDE